MIGEIIAIGNELTSGRVLDTNSRFAAGQLFGAGHEIIAMATIGDSPEEIGRALKRAIARSDFVVVTGGLGATSDDLTNEAVALALKRPSVLFPEVLEKIRRCPAGQSATEMRLLEKLAWLPDGAEVLSPERRMAGYLLIHDHTPVFFLPGVPHEMQELLAERVIPRLALWQGESVRRVRQRVYKIFGRPEIEINRLVGHLEKASPRVRIGYYPVFPEVHLSLTVIDGPPATPAPAPSATTSIDTTANLFDRLAAQIEAALGDCIFGRDEETLEGVVGCLLRTRAQTLALAESCTGGLIAGKLTALPGSSAYFSGGVVSYSNDLKEKFLGVGHQLLLAHGAVSGPVARAMAEGVRERAGVDLALSVTGIAGPGGGSAEKPVGTVYFGLATLERTLDFLYRFAGDRRQIREIAAATALDLLRRHLLGKLLQP